MGRRPARRAGRRSSARSGRACCTRLRRRVPDRLPGGLPAGAAVPTSSASSSSDPAGDLSLSLYLPARVAGRRPRVQALAVRPAAAAVRRAAAAGEHGRDRHQRAAVRDPPARLPAALDLRLRPAARRGRRPPARPGARALRGRIRPCVARRDRERRVQQARPLGRAHGARDRRPSSGRQVPAPDGDRRSASQYMEETLAGHPEIAANLVRLFRLRLDPLRSDHDAAAASTARSSRRSTRSRASTRTASCAASSR